MGLEDCSTRRVETIDEVTQTSGGEPHSAAHGQERREGDTLWRTYKPKNQERRVLTWKTAPVAPLPSTLVVHQT